MKSKLIATIVVLASTAWAGHARADLKVVATVPSLAALARDIGGDHVEVQSLSLPTQDPHFVDARPSLALALNRADLLLAVGLELEIGWLPVLQTGARNGRIQVGSPGYLDCSQFVHILEVPTTRVDRSMGDVHPGGNPHYLYDPRQGARVAAGIAERLAELDEENAAAYREGARRVAASLDRAIAAWEKRAAPWRGQPVAPYHKSWVYVADWLGLAEVTFLEPKPGIPPNPAHVARVLATARARGVKLILQEVYYPKATATLVARKIPAALVRLPGGADIRGGQTYAQSIDQMVGAFERGFEEAERLRKEDR